jgi:CDP-diacylglycerol--serine O-phosphatidyltransferase
MTKHLPNFITSLNLLCGALAVFFAYQWQIETAAYLIFIAAVFDFFDGFAARAFMAYSEIGKQLDSLADLISFGLAPSAILVTMSFRMMDGETGVNNIALLPFAKQLVVLFPLVLAVFAGLRLAKFNVDTRQTESFLGLTTTATGMFVASLGLLWESSTSWVLPLVSPLTIVVMVAIFSSLLVSEIPMFSLKFKNFKLMGNGNRYLLLVAGLIFIIFFNLGGIAPLILLYILFSAITALLCKGKNKEAL